MTTVTSRALGVTLTVFLAAIARAENPCTQDALRLCAGVQPGGGRIVACLNQQRASISDECRQTIDGYLGHPPEKFPTGPSAARADDGAVPAAYRATYDQLKEDLDLFRDKLQVRWDGRRHPVLFSAELLTANSNRGTVLIDPRTMTGVKLEMDAMQRLGVQAVTFPLGFPILYQPFYVDYLKKPELYDQFLAFYRAVADEARRRGLKLVVESQVAFSSGVGSDLPLRDYYKTLTFDQYRAGRSLQIQQVARLIKPDFLSIQQEPDTEVAQSGFSQLNDPAVSANMLRGFLADLKNAGLHQASVGAGAGSWSRQALEFARVYSQIPDLDFFSVHIYPVNRIASRSFLDEALAMADIAAKAGKRVAITEAWLHKQSNDELLEPFPIIEARDAWSFWAPLDTEFLQEMVLLAHVENMLLVSPFWTTHLYAYVDFNQLGSLGCPEGQCSPGTMQKISAQAGFQAIRRGETTSTGQAYSKEISESISK